AQQRLWFIEQLEPGKTAYNVPLAVSLSGELDYEALRAALSEIVRRHEVLRTRFVNEDGEAVQVIEAVRAVLVPVIDVSQLGEPAGEVKRIAQAEAKRAFELSKGELLRTVLVRLGVREHVLVVVLHHIVSDGWSVGVLINEFNALYEAYRHGEASPLPELPLQYGDYAVWQRNWLQGEVLERELQYWRRQLNGLERLELPADKSRSEKTGHGEVVRFEIQTDLLERLRQLSRREGVTLFMLLAAGLKLVLSRHAGQSDVAIGTAIANRNRVEIEPLVGFFVNQLVLRTQVDRDLSVRDLLKRVRETVLGAYAHQDLPFERLVEDIAPSRDAFRSPLFQVMLVMQNFVNVEMQLEGLATANLNIGNGDAKYDLMLTLDERAEEIVAELEFSTDLFTRATIERFGEHYLRVLDACTRDVEQRLSSIKLTSGAETAQLIAKVNAAARPFPVECVQESFRRQAAKTPNAIAVEDDQVAWTYAELDRYSDYVARNLVRARVSPGSLVAICLERSVEMVAAILGVLKAGAAYVPLDSNYPVDRLEYMLRDSGVAATITDDRLDVSGPKLLVSDLLSETSGQQLPHVSPDTLAYVIYTSGSTGAPKGVAITHAGLSNHMSWFDEAFALGADDRVLQKTVVSFDASVWEFYAPLLSGGTLVMASPGAHADPATLIENIRRKRVTMVQVVPTMLRLLVNHAGWNECTSLRFVFCGGEALTDDLAQRVFETSC
ncbi:MAG TPA: condensation domain-containing protein, partial [Pyrinomonadaceae bacterium]|nr:condensation domain-containing protein [Pyrinomonadaceae bacterium]